MVVVFLLPGCISIFIHLMKLAIEQSTDGIIDYLESLVKVELKPRILNHFIPS